MVRYPRAHGDVPDTLREMADQRRPERPTPTTYTTPRPAARRTRGAGARPVTRPVSFPPPARRDRVVVAPPAPPAEATGSIRDEHASAPPVTLTHEAVVTGDVAERLLAAYRRNFDPLAELAMQRQSSDRDEMLAEFENPRIQKIVAWERGLPVGLGMVTNHLESVPDISPAFLRTRYPEHAARDAIYIGMYVMVDPDHRGLTLFNRIYLEMWQVPARVGGLMIFDVCEFNRVTFDTDVLAERIASNFPRSSVEVLDRQTWYVAELPEPIPEAPSQPTRRR